MKIRYYNDFPRNEIKKEEYKKKYEYNKYKRPYFYLFIFLL